MTDRQLQASSVTSAAKRRFASKDVMRVKSDLEKKFAELTYEGCWFSPLMDAIQVFMDKTQEVVNGTVRVQLYKGQAVVEGMKSDSAIYRYDLATYSEGDAFDHTASVGFIKVWGLPIKTWTQTHGRDTESLASVSVKKIEGCAEAKAS